MSIGGDAGNSFHPEIKRLEVLNPGPLGEGNEEATEAGVDVKWKSPLRSQVRDFTDRVDDAVRVLRRRGHKLQESLKKVFLQVRSH